MDDLNGLDWSASSKSAKPTNPGTGNYYPTLRPTPPVQRSGATTPLSAQGSGLGKAGSGSKPAGQDSFANLVSFGSSKSANNLTLQEQQQRLHAERSRQQAEQKNQYEAQFGNSQFWDGHGATPSLNSPPATTTSRTASPALAAFPTRSSASSTPLNNGILPPTDSEADLFAAFSSETKVDRSSHYPPPSIPTSRKNTPLQTQRLDLSTPSAWQQKSATSSTEGNLGDDDDPFGLGQMSQRSGAAPPIASTEDDDFLGDLGKPVEEVKRQAARTPEIRAPSPQSVRDEESDDPWDKAVSELLDMGFSAENSRRALTESSSGLDVQAAVGWLLNDAHRQAKQKFQGKDGSGEQRSSSVQSGVDSRRRGDSPDRRGDAVPAWMRQEGRDSSQPRRGDSRSPANSDSDVAKTAAAVGSTLLKSANSLWKTSQKKVQKAVAEFSQEVDPSQPKWMQQGIQDNREQSSSRPVEKSRQRGRQDAGDSSATNVTDEAMMLEGDSRPQSRRPNHAPEHQFPQSGSSSSRDQSPLASTLSTGRSTPVPRWQQTTPATALEAKSRLSKQALEEQSAQAYVSPARRKKAPVPTKPADEGDLLFSDSQAPIQPATRPEAVRPRPQAAKSAARTSKPSTPTSVRPTAPARNIPQVSAPALAASSQHRLAGTSHFKLGDYASAHASYSAALSPLPSSHPMTIIIFCNRALTGLKTGEPKSAVTDAESALALIGSSRGEGESIDLGPDGRKDMKEFWGKALMRKAEALEQMERWSDARAVWSQAVEGGVGGGQAIQGRQRCDKALQPKPKSSTPKPVQRVAPKPKTSALSDLGPSTAASSEAVTRMRAANAAAEKADDEKFALSDSVDARLAKWRDGRKDNLRALLGGMDQVLWEGSGWKKVGMHELVINSKVKINYMKAIAKVHPDKLAQNATTEQQMISAAVFATLNEAWDKFKTENGM